MDPAKIVTASHGRGTIGCGCNRAWSKEMQKGVRLWKSESGTERNGQEEMMAGFFLDK